MVLRARTLNLDLDEVDWIGEAIDFAYATIKERIAAGEFDLSDVFCNL